MMIRRVSGSVQLMAFQIQLTLMEEIREAQKEDLRLLKFTEQVEEGLRSDVRIYTDGALYFRNRICMPQGEIRQKILTEAHSSAYSIHPGGTKIYQDLKQHFWWNVMKREIAQYVVKLLAKMPITLFGGGKIEDREVNSLFDSKESYNGSIILLQERGDIQA